MHRLSKAKRKESMKKLIHKTLTGSAILLALLLTFGGSLQASSHREAPLIADDPLADNTDLYVFR
ncbi:MAG: DUF4331 family protein, partial [Bacteroidia bacterium]|nr:DUF4331 family protein [Bacteroidia bacterium]